MRRHRRAGPPPRIVRPAVLAPVVVLALLVAGCGAKDKAAPSGPNVGALGPAATAAPTSIPALAGPGAGAGRLPADAAVVQVGSSRLGDVLVDGNGHTLYVWTGPGAPQCAGPCPTTFPAAVGASIAIGPGVKPQPGELKLVPGPYGPVQLAVNGRPAFRYAGDQRAGDVKGQGRSGGWFVVGADGQPVTSPG